MNCRLGSFPNSTSLSCKFDGFISVSAGQLYMFKGMPTCDYRKWLVTEMLKTELQGAGYLQSSGSLRYFNFHFQFVLSRLCDQGESRR